MHAYPPQLADFVLDHWPPTPPLGVDRRAAAVKADRPDLPPVCAVARRHPQSREVDGPVADPFGAKPHRDGLNAVAGNVTVHRMVRAAERFAQPIAIESVVERNGDFRILTAEAEVEGRFRPNPPGGIALLGQA